MVHTGAVMVHRAPPSLARQSAAVYEIADAGSNRADNEAATARGAWQGYLPAALQVFGIETGRPTRTSNVEDSPAPRLYGRVDIRPPRTWQPKQRRPT